MQEAIVLFIPLACFSAFGVVAITAAYLIAASVTNDVYDYKYHKD
jgi:hypothetical protein